MSARSFTKRLAERLSNDEKKAPREARETPSAPQRVYDDTDVCLLLGKRRRVLVAARTAASRGRDWDIVAGHAGMTESWIRSQQGDPSSLKPIRTVGVVTVEVVQRVPNLTKLVCSRLDGLGQAVVDVADSRSFHLGDQFDVVVLGGRMLYSRELNREAY